MHSKKVDFEFGWNIDIYPFQSLSWWKPCDHSHLVELVAAMSEQRVCDMCLQPYVSAGCLSNCTRECPSRRGIGSDQVLEELVASGNVAEGVHRRSPLLTRAQERIMVLTEQNAAGMVALYDRVSELERRIRALEHQRHVYRNIQLRIMYYNGGDYDFEQRRTSSRPATEPTGHVNG